MCLCKGLRLGACNITPTAVAAASHQNGSEKPWRVQARRLGNSHKWWLFCVLELQIDIVINEE